MPESTDNYTSVVHDLASAIAAVFLVKLTADFHFEYWFALVLSIGLAAVTLGLDRDANADRVDGERAQMLAVEALVCHRPGSWEADHVRALTFPPDLIAHPDRP